MADRMNLRGSIVKVRLSPTEGREQSGTRPAIVVSPTFINERSDILVVLPITSKKVDRVYPFEASIDHEAAGLEMPSKAMANQVRAIDKGRVVGVYGVADARTMASINEALQLALGLIDL
jgi:mRNA interferase MazF